MVGNHSLLGATEAQYQYLIEKYPRVERFVEKLARRVAAITTDLERQLHSHVLGTPLLEVLSVKIRNDEGSAGAFQVYGTIIVIDGEGAAFNLYNREEEDAETVTMCGSLTLIMPKIQAMCASGEISLLVDLMDTTQGAVFANGLHFWDYKSKDDYDVVQTKKFGSAIMECITYRHAVIATIDITLVRGRSGRDDNGVGGMYAEHDTGEDVDVFGEVIAHCFGNYSITLFKRTEQQSESVRLGCPIELLRYVVAVPSCSSLVVVPNLRYLDTKEIIVSKIMIFDAQHYSYFFGVKRDVDGQNGHIRVMVHWSHAYMQPQLESKWEDMTILDCELRKRVHVDSPKEEDDVFLNGSRDPARSFPLPGFWEPSVIDYGDLTMEVFSVSIGGDNNGKPFEHVHGTIKLWGCRGRKVFLFKEGLENGTRVLPNQLLDIVTSGQYLVGDDFIFEVDLKDGGGRTISYGEVCWDDNSLDKPIAWYGKPLCSIFRGNVGYAALHYMLIIDGVLATVRVSIERGGRNNNNNTTIIPSSNNNNNVHGSIFAEYSKYQYETWYDKEHYRHKLFQSQKPHILENGEEEEEVDMTMPCSDFLEIALTRSALVVPRTSALIIDVDLTLGNPSSSSSSSFRDRLTFNVEMDRGREQSIKGSCGNAVAVVNVLWSKVERLLSRPAGEYESDDVSVDCSCPPNGFPRDDGTDSDIGNLGLDIPHTNINYRHPYSGFSLYDDSELELECGQYLGSPVTMQVDFGGILP